MVNAQLFGYQGSDGSWVFLLEAVTSKTYSCDKLYYSCASDAASIRDTFACMRIEFALYQRLMRRGVCKLVHSEFHEYNGNTIIPERMLIRFTR